MPLKKSDHHILGQQAIVRCGLIQSGSAKCQDQHAATGPVHARLPERFLNRKRSMNFLN